MKNWKPKINEWVWKLDLGYPGKSMFEGAGMLKKWRPMCSIFRTKALAQSALRDVKKVLKKARKA